MIGYVKLDILNINVLLGIGQVACPSLMLKMVLTTANPPNYISFPIGLNNYPWPKVFLITTPLTTLILCLVWYGIWCQCGNFSKDTSYEKNHKCCHKWLKLGWNPCQLWKQSFGILCIQEIMWWNVIMDDWYLDEISLDKWELLQHDNSTIPPLFFINKEWQIMLGKHSMLVTLHGQFTNWYQKWQIELVTLNTLFNVLLSCRPCCCCF